MSEHHVTNSDPDWPSCGPWGRVRQCCAGIAVVGTRYPFAHAHKGQGHETWPVAVGSAELRAARGGLLAEIVERERQHGASGG